MSEVAVETIPNGSLFGTSLSTIEIYESTSNGDDSIYQAAVSFKLDDGSGADNGYNMTIFTELFHSNAVKLAQIAFLYASTLYPYMNPEYVVFDLDGNLKGKFKFSEMFMVPENYALH